jgi:hypothetical protein
MGDYELTQLLLVVSARRLPVVDFEGGAYFFDFRLSQLRKVDEPHQFLDLSPSESRDILEAVAYLEVNQRYVSDRLSRARDEDNIL